MDDYTWTFSISAADVVTEPEEETPTESSSVTPRRGRQSFRRKYPKSAYTSESDWLPT